MEHPEFKNDSLPLSRRRISMSASPPLSPGAAAFFPPRHEIVRIQIEFSRAPRLDRRRRRNRLPRAVALRPPGAVAVPPARAVVVVEGHSDFVVGAHDGRHLEQRLAQAFQLLPPLFTGLCLLEGLRY